MGDPVLHVSDIGMDALLELVEIVRQATSAELAAYHPIVRIVVLSAVSADNSAKESDVAAIAMLIDRVLSGRGCGCEDCAVQVDAVHARSPAWQRAAEALKGAL